MKKLRLNQELIKKIWIAFGAILLFMMSPFFQCFIYPFWYNIDGQSFPAFSLLTAKYLSYPFSFSRQGWLTVFMFALVTFNFFPFGLFLYGSLKIRKNLFFSVFFTLVTVTLLLNISYFYRFWGDGLHIQGGKFLHNAVIKNALYFSFIGIFMGLYYIKRNYALLHVALLLFCVTLSIVAFPFLGRMSS